MSDLLLDLGKNPFARKTIKRLGLPLPMPQDLRRAGGPWEDRPLTGRTAAVGTAPGSVLEDVIRKTLEGAGATIRGAAEKPDVLVFDATGCANAADLKSLYDFFHPRIRGLARCGRVIVVGRAPDSFAGAEAAAAQAALDGFVRSVAKEIGAKGSTAHLVQVDDDAADRLAPVLRFLLSDHSAFLSGQPWRVTSDVEAPEETPIVRVLKGKVAMVTGAARGIGAATAKALAAEGAKVIVVDRPEDEDAARALAAELGGIALGLDVTADDAVERIREKVAPLGGLDILVNNAGITRDKTLGKMPAGHWDSIMAVNLEAVVRLSEGLIEEGLNDGGRIVCLSSIAGLAGNLGQTNYAASKAAVAGFVRSLGEQVAERGIAVNAIAPGFIETRLTAAIPVMNREAARRLSALGQGGLPEDIADLVVFLSSPGAAGLCGQVQRACGGMFVGA